MKRIVFFILMDILKNKIVLFYALVLALLSLSVFYLEDSSNKGQVTLLNLILLVVPLVSVLFSTIYLYNSAEFIELLLSQPVKRKQIWISLYLGLSSSLATAFFISAGLPLLFFADTIPGLYLLASGLLLTLIFVSLAFLSAISSRDKAKGIGIALMQWLYFALLFDGLVLYLMFQLGDYPIEKPMVFLSLLSPVDLARIFNLLQLDSAVMLGYTGAIFRTYFGSGPGMVMALLALVLWALVPFYISLLIFNRKDL